MSETPRFPRVLNPEAIGDPTQTPVVCLPMSETDTRDEAVARLTAERLAFTKALGFGDGVTEPAATLAQMIDPIQQAYSDAQDHIECPRICPSCDEWLADKDCPQCHGSGCLPAMAYQECDTCTGVGKIHEGCAGESYTDLVDQRDAARAEVAALRSAVERLADEWERDCDRGANGRHGYHATEYGEYFASDLRSLLASVGSSGEAESGCGHPNHGATDHDCAPFAAPVSSWGQAGPLDHDFRPVAGHPDDDECTHRPDGTDATYCGQPKAAHEVGGQADGGREIPLGTVRRASQAFLMAQSDYLGQDLAFMDAPMRAALAAARPVLSREALARAWWIQEAVDGGSDRAWAEAAWDDMGGSEPTDERAEYEIRADAVLGVLTAGGEQDG